ncbi:hypothetical protein AHY58_002104 [Salmonella enterica subsp. enterica]|uniref:hypothetical protein n=1 Tax=Salmonella enterica TaxID=28901 RepID=UPI0009EC4747|nr:hypothetical protein [Salmonella enterica]EBQ5245755.1 hypothetical protein [Salmonella enterica subsp. salamae]EEC0863872.1 hypothetical protein [Salmonella enterica subsp. enterica serovar Mikawasima]EGS3384418.1 hypothetical protein [Salmonella enterica subsp. enterica serovar Mikawasima]
MTKLVRNGFVKTSNDFSQCSAAKLMRHFHQFGFKDAEGRDLVACEDFADLVEQFCRADRNPPETAAEVVLRKYEAQEVMDYATNGLREGN